MSTNAPIARDRSLLRVHARIVALLTLLALGAAVVVALTQPLMATVESRVELRPESTGGAPLEPDMGTEREVATSGLVAAAAASQLGTTRSEAEAGLSVSVVTDTRVLAIRYSAPTTEAAFNGGLAFTQSYVEAHNEGKRNRAAVAITEPRLVSTSSGTAPAVIIVMGLLAGLTIGVAAAWVWDRMSDRVRSPGELDRSGIPVFATSLVIPQGGARRLSSSGRTGFGFLAGRLVAATGGDPRHLRILVTAPRPGSGTSAVALNVAASLRTLGSDATIIDANPATDGVADIGGDTPVPGLGNSLLSDSSVEQATRRVNPSEPRIARSVMTGAPPRLEIERLGEVLGRLSSDGSVVIDGPPLLEAPEAFVLAGHVDVVLLVADLRSLRRRDVTEIVHLLEPTSPSVVGWVTHTPEVARRRLRLRPGKPDRSELLATKRINGSAVRPRVRTRS